MLAIRTILHPTDFSAYSDYAFRLACALARDYGARLVLLHVAKLPVMAYGEGVVPPDPVLYREHLWERLQQVQTGDVKIPAEYRLMEGDAATEILRIADETHADLILLGTHGRTGLGRLLMGSVAEQVVRRATCPVLTVKGPRCPVSVEETSSPALAGEAASGAP